MAKFQVGESPSSEFTIGNSRCKGGTWYSYGDVGVAEEVLARDYPFLKWDSEPKRYSPKKEKISLKLTKEEFLILLRFQQEALLKNLNINFSKKDKEIELWKKYVEA